MSLVGSGCIANELGKIILTRLHAISDDIVKPFKKYDSRSNAAVYIVLET